MIWIREHTPTPSNKVEIGSFPWVHHMIDRFPLKMVLIVFMAKINKQQTLDHCLDVSSELTEG